MKRHSPTEMPNKSVSRELRSLLQRSRPASKSVTKRETATVDLAEVEIEAMGVPEKAPASLSARAYVEIRNKILRGDLPIGVALSRRQLANELNISVPPVT